MSGLLENLSAGTGGGILGTVLGYLGLSQRLNRMQTEIDCKVSEPTFAATVNAIKEQHKSMDKKLDIIIENSTYKRGDGGEVRLSIRKEDLKL